MLVLHALWGPDGPWLWAEDVDRTLPDPAAAAGGQTREPGRRVGSTHPFAAPLTALMRLDALRPHSGMPPATGGVDILLLSDSAGPLPSPIVAGLRSDTDPHGGAVQRGVARAGESDAQPSPRWWRVPAIRLDLGGGTGLSRGGGVGWVAGASLRFFVEICDFAADLVDRGRLLPDVILTADGPEGRWTPFLAGADLQRLTTLRDAMPPGFPLGDTQPTNTSINPQKSVGSPISTHRPEKGPQRRRQDALSKGTASVPGTTPTTDASATASTTPDGALRASLAAAVDAQARQRIAAAKLATVSAAADEVSRGWVAALHGEPRFTGPGDAVRELAERVARWRARGGTAPSTVVCFRLHEPNDAADPEAGWRVEFLVRPASEPSLLVDAERVWDGRADRLAVWSTHPQDTLLAALGRAAEVWPLVRRALLEARPTGVTLDVAEAYAFLQSADELEQSGFEVLVPTFWRRPARVGLALSVRAVNPVVASVRDAAMSLDEMVDFRWEVSLGGERLSRAELAELAAAKLPLVRVRGRWTRLDPALLAAGLDRTRRAATGRMTARAALRHAGLRLPTGTTSTTGPTGTTGTMSTTGPISTTMDDLDVEVRADGWLGALLGGPLGDPSAHEVVEFVEAPAGLAVTLRPYQRRGLAWLAFLDRLGVGALLADDMGLGKTVQVLALELHTRHADTRQAASVESGLGRREIGARAAAGRRAPTLVVCPTSVVGHWVDEAARAAPGLRVLVHHASDRARGAGLARQAAAHDLVITTYAVVRRDAASLAAVDWDRLVLDEAQQIKNSGTQLAQAVRQLPARHRVALTGTPVENRLADLWSIMDVLNPGLLGSASRFRARYAVPIERYEDGAATERLRARVRPVMLRRVKTNPAVLAELPERTELRELCTLSAEQASLYRAVLDDMLDRLADTSPARRKGVALTAITRLKQVCNHPAHLLDDASALPGRSGKLARVEEVLDQVITGGERALCFTQYARFGAMLAPYLAGRHNVEVAFLHGGTPRRERDALVRRFQGGDGPGIFLLSLRAGGTGLTLTAANHVLHLDRWWNPATEAQATDRAYRIGQRRGVQVRTFVCMGTLEERVDRMLADKSALARTMVGNGESWLASLSTEQLRDLCVLAPEVLDA
ncbi:DNA/RNA helicase, superfamily II, SNF2 family [Frankia sp. AiPs1]|uniref:DEAD/DEAH box helicase n=1 Tax=Frankia sp. AiPa1 TaxID=573492 RepID=UPI00202B8A24|nr:DEAD/DEAH box helicase [Frankia sp. AiPa1]MCL9762599.1 DEAD/DEAH box helicase [Frankia sp. AiPa1]